MHNGTQTRPKKHWFGCMGGSLKSKGSIIQGESQNLLLVQIDPYHISLMEILKYISLSYNLSLNVSTATQQAYSTV